MCGISRDIWVHTEIHTYIQKVSFYNIEDRCNSHMSYSSVRQQVITGHINKLLNELELVYLKNVREKMATQCEV